MQCTGLNLTSPFGHVILVMSFLEILEQQHYAVLNLKTEAIHQQGICYGIRYSIRTGRAKTSLVSVSSLCPHLPSVPEASLACCPAWRCLWGGEEPAPCGSSTCGFRGLRVLQQGCCQLCGPVPGLWQQHKCCSVFKTGFQLFPIPIKGRAAACVAIRLTCSEPGKGEKVRVDLEGEEWEGILTESNICFIKKQNENKCLDVLWRENVKAEVNSLLLL